MTVLDDHTQTPNTPKQMILIVLLIVASSALAGQVVLINLPYLDSYVWCNVGDTVSVNFTNNALVPGCINTTEIGVRPWLSSLNIQCNKGVPTFDYFNTTSQCSGTPTKSTTLSTCASVDIFATGTATNMFASCVEAHDYVIRYPCTFTTSNTSYAKQAPLLATKLNSCVGNGAYSQKQVVIGSNLVTQSCTTHLNVSSQPLNTCTYISPTFNAVLEYSAGVNTFLSSLAFVLVLVCGAVAF